jgi:hypothetical protein
MRCGVIAASPNAAANNAPYVGWRSMAAAVSAGHSVASARGGARARSAATSAHERPALAISVSLSNAATA